MVLVDQPDTARMAVAFIDKGFREGSEEAFDVRLAHKKVERELDGTRLDLHETLRMATLGRFANQRGAKNLRFAFNL
jgi:hypothetical protein